MGSGGQRGEEPPTGFPTESSTESSDGIFDGIFDGTTDEQVGKPKTVFHLMSAFASLISRRPCLALHVRLSVRLSSVATCLTRCRRSSDALPMKLDFVRRASEWGGAGFAGAPVNRRRMCVCVCVCGCSVTGARSAPVTEQQKIDNNNKQQQTTTTTTTIATAIA